MRGRRRVWKVLAFAGFVIVGLAVLSLLVMLLWNALLPSLFGVRPLHYLQAVGLLVLSRVLFGGLRGHHGRWGHRGWRERWESLTPQERERLRDKYARHCRWHGSGQESENHQL